MDIQCPKCSATYRMTPDGSGVVAMECGACGHRFGVRLSEDEAVVAAPKAPETVEPHQPEEAPRSTLKSRVGPELMRMMQEEAALSAARRAGDTPAIESDSQAEAVATDKAEAQPPAHSEAAAPEGAKPVPAPEAPPEPAPVDQPASDPDEVTVTPDPKPVQEVEADGVPEDDEALDPFAEIDAEMVAAEAKADADADKADTDAATQGPVPEELGLDAPRPRRSGPGLLISLLIALILLGGAVALINHFATDLAALHPAFEAPLALFVEDVSALRARLGL